MTINELAKKIKGEILALPDPKAEVMGGYCGDLLSNVMAKAKSGQVWITVITHAAILGVAAVSKVSGILIVENSEIDTNVIKKAQENGVNVIRTSLSAYEVANLIGEFNI